MTPEHLDEIEARAKAASEACGMKGRTAIMLSAEDIPDLIAEVRRLWEENINLSGQLEGVTDFYESHRAALTAARSEMRERAAQIAENCNLGEFAAYKIRALPLDPDGEMT